ncbi:Myotubularin protein 14 [Paragonimus skrjabini miyazakii]|uniref:Myotubularin protein 14 n=1 Tax=Paragonimus skrjabini miyazakii TaxID=59628 RepID=A0A8S9Y9B5_9TREM|nr:Myotubularin protein 14 [Paragonimus skrjabini miyazakii]
MQQLKNLMGLMLKENYTDSLVKFLSPTLTTAVAIWSTFENEDGSLCSHYPPSLFIPSLKVDSVGELSSLISQAKFARGRTRFVVPAFIFQGKNVCRSSTLSGSLELYGRQVANIAGFSFDTSSGLTSGAETRVQDGDDRSMMHRVRDVDCELMKRFRIRYICDFMLEYRKVKYWLPVTSSEKDDNHDRYDDFVILPLPYPGSEFFRVWRDSGYVMNNLMFNWDQPTIDVTLRDDYIPKTLLSANVNWKNYKSWDVTTLTKNYLKLLLGQLFEGAGGMLLHCVSGWDRTPLFISLMRCLLWADDLAHPSLEPAEMLYFTLAYDWFLFGHKLHTRLESGEEILRFAFCFLSTVAADSDLSIRAVYDMVLPPENFTPDTHSRSHEFVEIKWSPSLLRARQERLQQLAGIFFNTWDLTLNLVNEASPASNPIPRGSDRQTREGTENPICGFATENNESTSDFSRPMKTSLVSQISNAVSSAAVAVTYGLSKPFLINQTSSMPSLNEADSSLSIRQYSAS